MPKLLVQNNQIKYQGFFSKPAFSFWGNGARLLEGLYNTFYRYGIGISNIQDISKSANPSDQAVGIFFEKIAYILYLDHIDATIFNFNKKDLLSFSEFLQAGDIWLRETLPEFSFKQHSISTTKDSIIEETSSKEFLMGLSKFDLEEIGLNAGHGHIFHWETPENRRKLSLLINHSLSLNEGLYTIFSSETNLDLIDYKSDISDTISLFNKALSKIGLME